MLKDQSPNKTKKVMSHLSHIQKFGKQTRFQTTRRSTKNAVIYTRVSSKEQADNNQSLEVQKKHCDRYAQKHGLTIMGYFGGTYESAKTDERKEFNRMIRFVKSQREGVSFILVYTLDRFSRTGDNAIFISSELKKRGISIISATQPIDVSTHSGVLQQNIQFIFSKYDNDLRREKCIDGMREKLLRGEWTGVLPVGYEYDRSGGPKAYKVKFDKRAVLIAKAFELKAQGLSNTEVALKISNNGYQANRKRIFEIIHNPFYCGYIAHSLLDGQIVKGKHKALVSEELFLTANEVMKSKRTGHIRDKGIDAHVPLKHFVRCAECNTPMTGYIVKKKNLYYYKCNKIGCGCNVSARTMHTLYKELLQQYQVDPELKPILREQLLYTYEYLTQSDKEIKSQTQRKRTELQNKLYTLEERFAFGEVERDIYERVSNKLKEELTQLDSSLASMQKELSNPVKFIEKSLEICSNLAVLWDSAECSHRKQMQELFFPEGILYDKKISGYRTQNVNAVLEVIGLISNKIKDAGHEASQKTFDLPALVASAGIEPASSESESEILSIVLRSQNTILPIAIGSTYGIKNLPQR
jgi:site-specific DNA recombinase